MVGHGEKITLGEMREAGVRGLLVYCADHKCSVRLSDLEPRFVCQACDKRGAEVRPDFEPARMGTAR